jgi:hypothetical protein
VSYEGWSVSQKNLQELQDCETEASGAYYLQRKTPQAKAGLNSLSVS